MDNLKNIIKEINKKNIAHKKAEEEFFVKLIEEQHKIEDLKKQEREQNANTQIENNIPSLEERVDALEEAVIDLLLVRGEEE